MKQAHQSEYLKRRAAQERVAAKLAGDARAARAHAQLAQSYEAMVTRPELPAAR